ncbi:MAG TPA: hypothetical protein VFJ92_16035 [Gemmatimonadales bacterium]|nr:hypothetical protein [Gemmatimonadales bacterium]
MKRILTACLSLGAALAFAATAEAQDTTQAGAAPMPADTAPTTQMQGDTLGGDSTRSGYPADTTTPGYRGMGTDSVSDSTSPGASTGAAPAPGSTSTEVPSDTTLPGDQYPRQPAGQEERIHSDSAGADSSSP